MTTLHLFGPVSGKIKLTRNCNITKLSGYNVINMKVPGGNYSDLHACNLKTKNGYIMENIWQSCKVHDNIPAYKYKKHGTLIWKHKAETHMENGIIKDSYFAWKEKLIKNKYPVLYPCGYSNRNKYQFLLNNNKKYNYNDGFYNIYLPMYFDLIKNKERFNELHYRINKGENILIICDNLPYKEIEFNIVNKDHIFYSSGYCLALALLKKFNIY